MAPSIAYLFFSPSIQDTVDKGATQNDRWGRIYKRRQSEYVTSLPSLLDYFSFVYHYPGILGGPNTYYREFIDIIENRRYPYGAIPAKRWRWAALDFAKGVLFLGLFVVASIWVPTSALLEEEFANRWLGTRIVIAYLTYVGVRFRYYGLWKLGESLCICGGYGEEANGDWRGISNVDIVHFELCTSMSMATHAWNKRTQRWLQMCIYERSHFNQLYFFYHDASIRKDKPHNPATFQRCSFPELLWDQDPSLGIHQSVILLFLHWSSYSPSFIPFRSFSSAYPIRTASSAPAMMIPGKIRIDNFASRGIPASCSS